MFQMPRARALASAIPGALLCAGLPLSAIAAEPAAEFAVSPAQMQSLGVTVRKLDQPAAIAELLAGAGFEHIRHPRTLRPFVTGIVTARKPQRA